MNDNCEQRGGKMVKKEDGNVKISSSSSSSSSLYSLEKVKRDYRLKKQKIHAGLWVKEIEKQEEAKLGTSSQVAMISKNCSTAAPRFFILLTLIWATHKSLVLSSRTNLMAGKQHRKHQMAISGICRKEKISWFKNLSVGSHSISSRIASFIKQHIFSRRRPIDGWKYM